MPLADLKTAIRNHKRLLPDLLGNLKAFETLTAPTSRWTARIALKHINAFRQNSELLLQLLAPMEAQSRQLLAAPFPATTKNGTPAETPLHSLGLSARTVNALSKADLRTAGELAAVESLITLVQVRGLGEKGFDEVQDLYYVLNRPAVGSTTRGHCAGA